MKYNYFNIDLEAREKWDSLCPIDEYRIISGPIIDYCYSGILPAALYNKFDSVFIAGSSTDNGKVYYMLNGNRIDNKDLAIDQMPFGMAYIGNSVAGSACLIQHGNWINRTIHPPESFWEYLINSGTANYYPLTEMPTSPEGKLADLRIASQNQAFNNLIKILRQNSQ